MIIDVNLFIDTLAKHKLSFEQFMLCYLLCTDPKTGVGKNTIYSKRASLYKYHSEVKHWSLPEIGDLVQRGFIVDMNKVHVDGKRQSYPDHYQVTEKFTSIVFGDPDDMGEQLWKAYPDFFVVDGKRYPAKTCQSGKEELLEYYTKVIKKNKLLHQSIVSLVTQFNKSGEIKMGIEKWVRNHYWEIDMKSLESLIEKGPAHANRKL